MVLLKRAEWMSSSRKWKPESTSPCYQSICFLQKMALGWITSSFMIWCWFWLQWIIEVNGIRYFLKCHNMKHLCFHILVRITFLNSFYGKNKKDEICIQWIDLFVKTSSRVLYMVYMDVYKKHKKLEKTGNQWPFA